MSKKIRMAGLFLVLGLFLIFGNWQRQGQAAGPEEESLEPRFSLAAVNGGFETMTRPTTTELLSTITVTNTGDGPANAANCPGPNCRLRDAVAKAAAGDTINFSVTGTITLTSSDLIIDKNLTINGPGAELLTLDQTVFGSVFLIPSNTVTFTINNLTLTGGSANQGAGIENRGTTTLSNSTVTSNSAQFGGGIYNSGTMIISNSNILHNSANSGVQQGGGIHNVGDMTISGSTLSDNNALGGDGAGIYNTGNLNISNSTFSDSRSNYGSGISSDAGTVTITDTTFRNNTADRAGGAIYIDSGVLNISRSTLVANKGGMTNSVTPAHGGGIYNKGTATLTDCTLSANSATGDSGGINNFGTLTLINSTLSGNSSALHGGGISNFVTLTLINSTLSGNSAADGGGINNSSTVNVRNTLIAGNIGQVHGPDVNGPLISQGYNLIGNNSGTTITPMTGDLIGTAAAPINPLLAPLGDYGGPTQTHALAANSPAINAGNNCVTQTPGCLPTPLTTDQRGSGFNRLVGSAVDIGAFELSGNNTAPTLTVVAPLSLQQGSQAGAAVMIGTVSDVPTAAGSLTVTQVAGGSATGITVTDITNTNGTITAMVSASCTATSGTIRFQVSDGLFTNTGDLTVNVSANTSPILAYATASVSAGGSTTNTPTAATDNGSINSYVLQSQGLYTGTISVNSSGVVSISNAAPVGNHTIIIRAIDNCGATTDANFRLAVNTPNTAPTFTPAAAISRQRGSSAGASLMVGTVSDTQTAAGSLTVTQIAGGSATGITVTDITNTNGTITAIVSASCTAVAGTVRFQVSDGSLTGTGDLQVNVTANTAPTLSYGNVAVNAGASTTNSPTSATDNGSITGYVVQSQGTYTGTISVNTSGVVSISNAAPVGNHTITIRATDNCSATTNAQFTLTVNTPNTAPTFTPAAAISRQQGSPAGAAVTVGTVSDTQTAAGSLTVTQIAGGTATGITVTGITNTNGTITAIVSASCTAVAGTVRFQVSDGSLTGTGNLQVNVTANTAPTLTYGAASVNTGGSTTNSPTTATDNGSITGYIVQSQGTYTGTISVNTSGVVSISNAAPAGSHTITIRATDNCGATKDATFTLTVNNTNTAPTFTSAGAVSRQQGSPAGAAVTVGTVSDAQTAAGSLTVTQIAGGTATGITVSGITNTSGTITAIVSASCSAMGGTIRFQVSDGSLTGTGDLQVNLTANTTPTTGVYPDTIIAAGGSTTVSPSVMPADNGSITSITATATPNTFTGTLTANSQTGALTVTSANPAGSYTITVTITDNCGATTTRSFMLTVSSCGASLSKTALNFAASGGTGNFAVTINNACQWTVVSNDPGFITILSPTGQQTGSGTVTFNVANHTNTAQRSGTITVAGQTFTVRQGAQFLDVPVGASFYEEIGKLSAVGVTQGCSAGNYCPDSSVTREQMAAFLSRALGVFNPPTPATQRFADVPPSNLFYAFIEELAQRQITLGCGDGIYCPTSSVTREQMAAFIIRALHEPGYVPPAPGTQRFPDVPSSNPFYGHIEEMAVRQITLGCGGGNYCPADNVTRGQMAAFLVRAFGL